MDTREPSVMTSVNSFESRIVARGLVSVEELAEAQREAGRRGLTVQEALVALGRLTEDQIGTLTAEALGVAYVFPQREAIDRELVSLLPRELLLKHRVVPMLRDGEEVVLASARPLGQAAVDELEAACGGPVTYAIAAPRRIEALLGSPSAAEDPGAVAAFYGHLARAIAADATEIRFEAGSEAVTVRYRVAGRLEDRGREPLTQILAIRSRACALGKTQRIFRIGTKEFDLHATVLQAAQGESVLVRLLPASAPRMDATTIASLQAALSRTHGIVLISAPSPRACRVVAYEAMRAAHPESRSMVTLEREILEPEPRFRQVETHGEPVMEALRAALAYEPDVLFVGDGLEAQRDKVEAASRRRLVLLPGGPEEWPAAVVITQIGREIQVIEKDR